MASVQLGLKPLEARPALGSGFEYPETPLFPSRAIRRCVLFTLYINWLVLRIGFTGVFFLFSSWLGFVSVPSLPP